jgi:hypothetical protein
MTTLPNMGLELPDVGQDVDTWGGIMNANLSLEDAHDHTSGKGVPIRTDALDIDADLSVGGFALLDVGSIDFAPIAALAAGALRIFVSSSDNELYWRTSGGTNVKLTSGTSINTTLVGGIVGDYTSVSAEVAFDDAGQRYTFKRQGSPKPWARLASGDLRLFEHNTTETVFVGLACPAALAVSHTITLPTAAPASQALVQMDASGVLSASNTILANADITLSGTGVVKHGDRERCFPAAAIAGTQVATNGQYITSALEVFAMPLTFDVGERIKSVTMQIQGNGTVDVVVALRQMSVAGDALIGSTTTLTNVSASLANQTINIDDTTIATNTSYYLQFDANAGGFRVGSVCVTYDRP